LDGDPYAKEETMNTVSLIGNLATDVELREVGEDKKLATFLLAVDRSGADGADFVGIVVWDRQAESCARFLSKGKRVGVDGRLRSREWEDADGKRRRKLEVVGKHVQFLSPPDGAAAATPFEAAAAS
jgi:single-strand DNA-binding protein